MASALLCALLLAAAAAGCRSAPVEARPDLLLIVIDTLRADRLGTYGYHRPTSPTLDALARSALVYENASSTAPFTMPSMAALLTGTYADRVGVHNHSPKDRLSESATTLAEATSAAGYATSAIVSNPWLARRDSGFAQGFDTFISRRDLDPHKGRLTAQVIVDQALGVLSANDERPLFLWAHFIDTHMPYSPTDALAAEFGNETSSSRIIEDFNEEGFDRQSIYFEGDYPRQALEATRNLYDAAVRSVDEQIARLLDGWKQRRNRPRITVVVSDHGESLGDHGLFFAHDFTLFEELIHVPLIVAGLSEEPARIRTNVSLIDILPTLCVGLGLQCPSGLDGRPLPRTDRGAEPRTIFAAGPPKRARYDRDPWIQRTGIAGRWSMARRGSTKLLQIPQRTDFRWQAYDLATDPREVNSVYDPAKDAELTRELAAWREEMLAAVAKTAAPTKARMDPKTRAELRALGYLD